MNNEDQLELLRGPLGSKYGVFGVGLTGVFLAVLALMALLFR